MKVSLLLRLFVSSLIIQSLFLFPALAGDDYSKPVFKAVYPAEIKVSNKAEVLEITLRGEHLAILMNERIWNSRQMFLFVRHSAKGADWLPLYNNMRAPDYPNPSPPSFGYCDYITDQYMRVWLPLNVWCDKPGYLEFKLLKGKFGNNDSPLAINPVIESDVFKVPVRTSVGTVAKITQFFPNRYIVGEKITKPFYVYGEYAPEAFLLLDGMPLKMVQVDAAPGWMQAHLPANFTSKHARHVFRIKDKQDNVSPEREYWVYGPPKGEYAKPKELQVGALNTAMTVKFSGQVPEKLEAKASYVYSAVQAQQPGNVKVSTATAHIPQGTAARNAPQSQGSSPGQQETAWKPLPFTKTSIDEFKFKIPSEWLKQEGAISVRLSGFAGSSEFIVPIRKPAAGVQPSVQVDKAKQSLDKKIGAGVKPGQEKPGMNF